MGGTNAPLVNFVCLKQIKRVLIAASDRKPLNPSLMPERDPAPTGDTASDPDTHTARRCVLALVAFYY